MMKILFYSHFLPSFGGIERVTEQLADTLIELGHEVKIASYLSGAGTIPPKPYEVISEADFWTFRRLVRWCDVIIDTAGPFTRTWYIPFARKPWIMALHVRSNRFLPDGTLRGKIRIFVFRLIRKHYKLITVSEYMKSSHNIDAEVLPNPFNEDIFQRAAATKISPPSLGFVGRLVQGKGLNLLLEAYKILVDAHEPIGPLHIVGDGPLKSTIEAFATGHSLTRNIILHGRLDAHGVSDVLKKVAIAVIPSEVEEAFPLVALEALSCGCRIVATRAGGLPEAVGGLGEIAEKTVPSLVAAISRSSMQLQTNEPNHYEARLELHLRNYTRRNVAMRYIEYLDRVLRAR